MQFNCPGKILKWEVAEDLLLVKIFLWLLSRVIMLVGVF
jgi:hypothetical protein